MKMPAAIPTDSITGIQQYGSRVTVRIGVVVIVPAEDTTETTDKENEVSVCG
jgi:hypothetical protein